MALTLDLIESILSRLPALKVAVIGDLFLDRYLDLDATLTEPSLETGLDAYQVVRVRSYPGAAGTVINNLAALGVGRIIPVAVIGDDGEGYELRQALRALPSVDATQVINVSDRRTPTYTKPMLCVPGQQPRELNRLDIHNRHPLAGKDEHRLLELIDTTWNVVDALVILDQVSLPDCGVVTAKVRERLAQLGARDQEKIVLADSRARIGLFRHVSLKPNEREALAAVPDALNVVQAARSLALTAGRPVYCTRGEHGIRVVCGQSGQEVEVPAFPVPGPIDPVGAGDSTSAGIICALASGLNAVEAAAFGNLIASITVTKLGTTGTATPDEVRARWCAIDSGKNSP